MMEKFVGFLFYMGETMRINKILNNNVVVVKELSGIEKKFKICLPKDEVGFITHLKFFPKG